MNATSATSPPVRIDPLSGVATSATSSLTGGTPNGVGSYTATCAGATDKAGNASMPVRVTYRVHYRFEGFDRPVDNPPAVNDENAGRTIPLKWSPGGVTALSSLVSIQWQVVQCTTRAPAGMAMPAMPQGDSPRAEGGRFHYNLATERSWAGTCRQAVLTLDDGTTHAALFSFR